MQFSYSSVHYLLKELIEKFSLEGTSGGHMVPTAMQRMDNFSFGSDFSELCPVSNVYQDKKSTTFLSPCSSFDHSCRE